MRLPFQLIVDRPPSTRLDSYFAENWPAYARWIERSTTQDFAMCRARLMSSMPELLATLDTLHARLGETEQIGRFLTLYNPPRVVRACSQLILDTDEGPVLLRSYDHDPRLLDGIILRSDWAGTPTLAMADCVWGVLDGINGHGLTIALAFGGRNVTGDGFAAPLICRYILQTCATVAEARVALARLPVSMPYTFAVLDASGVFVTAFLGPDVEAKFVMRRASANHQGSIDWPQYARFVQSAERLERIETLVDPGVSIECAREAFLDRPVWRTDYARASGTLYVAEYAPAKKTLHLHWPDHTKRFDLDDSQERSFSAVLPEPEVTRDSTGPSMPA